MKNKMIAILVASTFAIAASGNVLARSTQDDSITCRSAITDQAKTKHEGATFKFGSVRGGSLRTLTYRMNLNGEKHKVICKIKRGELLEIVWPENT